MNDATVKGCTMVPGVDEKGTRLHSLVSLWAGRDDGHTAASTLADSNSSMCSSVDRGQEWMTNAIGWSESQCRAICSTKAAMTVVADPLSSQKKKKDSFGKTGNDWFVYPPSYYEWGT
jgi:hypothetical protein